MGNNSVPPLNLHPDRLFPADPGIRAVARMLYAEVCNLPIISPHGHTDPAWFADNKPFANPVELFIIPDHYVYRMLYSLGVPMEAIGIPVLDRTRIETDPRKIWRLFANYYHVFCGTPTRIWLDYIFHEVFGLHKRLCTETADEYYDLIDEKLKSDSFRPRSLFEQYNIEVLTTTESPLDSLRDHRRLQESGWAGRVISSFRPDPVLDPEYEGFRDNLETLSELTGEDCLSYEGYLSALIQRRQYFKEMGATSTDHGHPSILTVDLSPKEAQSLFNKVTGTDCTVEQAEQFRGNMLLEMARMSLEDGLVMQVHPGALRNHNAKVFKRFGRDKGADIPTRTDYVHALKPLLDRYGNEKDLSVILFTLDETCYSRELAPLAGHYPILKLGPAWWFNDSPEGIRRFRHSVTETAGFYNTVGFNDDTRAFLSIPARHDVSRRIDCAFLAELVVEHRLEIDEAFDIAHALAYDLVKQAYKL